MGKRKLTAEEVLEWAWWPPGEVAEPHARWWNDNDRFPSAVRALREHLAKPFRKGWRIVAITRDYRKVILPLTKDTPDHDR